MAGTIRATRRSAGSAAPRCRQLAGLVDVQELGEADGDADAPDDGSAVGTGVGRGVGTGPLTGGKATGIGNP